MPIRLIIAWLAGFVAYLLAMAMTTYDGFPSLVLQPIIGALLTTVAIVVIILLGVPLFFKRPWALWSKLWWVSLLAVIIGVSAMSASWHPALRVTVFDPDRQQTIESFHPLLAISGWFLMLFGLSWCPLLSIRRLIAWLRRKT